MSVEFVHISSHPLSVSCLWLVCWGRLPRWVPEIEADGFPGEEIQTFSLCCTQSNGEHEQVREWISICTVNESQSDVPDRKKKTPALGRERHRA